MRKEKGVTIITLAVTIIILIILGGITLNATVGENGIVTMAQKAKENMELAKMEEEEQLNSLYEELQNNGGIINDGSDTEAVEKLENFKKIIATAITNEGVETTVTDTAETMAKNISKVLQERTKDATAMTVDITEGKTAYVNGEKIIGTGVASSSEPVISKITTSAYTNRTWNYCRYNCTVVVKANNAKSFTLNEVNPSTIESVTGAAYEGLTFYPVQDEVTIVFELGQGNNNYFGGDYYIASYE